MTAASTDLVHLLQRRNLQAQEQRMARAAYAYGVDLRRAYWLGASAATRPMVGAADRRWLELTGALAREALEPPTQTPAALLQAVAEAAATLRAPVPTVRALTEAAAGADPWPPTLPLGTTHGAVQWLILEPRALMAMEAPARRFILASAIAHLQCDHGPLFTLHTLARRRPRARRVVRRVLAPWSRVAVFSADRAGALAVGGLVEAERGVRAQADLVARVPWWPTFPPVELRMEALRDFDRSVVMARVRRLRDQRAARARGQAPGADVEGARGLSPGGAGLEGDDTVGIPAGPGWSLARCDARLTRKLGLL